MSMLKIMMSFFGREMTRCEIAYVIANYVSGGNGYTADLSSLSAFADCGLIGTDDDGTMSKDIEIIDDDKHPLIALTESLQDQERKSDD